MKNVIIAAAVAAASFASAQTVSISRVAAVPPDVTRVQAELSKQLTPSAKTKVQRIAGSLVSKVEVKRDDKATMQLVSSELMSQFPGLPAKGQDVDALMFLVTAEAASAQEAELKATISEMQRMTKQKDDLRTMIAKAGAQPNPPPRPPNVSMAIAVPPAYLKAPPPLPADATVVAMQKRIDELSDMSEMDQLRVQMVMDRRTKFLGMLSNLLKKASATDAGILQSLK